MTWTQVYSPVSGSLLASALVAAIPVVVLLGLLAFLHVRAHWAALLGLAAAILIGVSDVAGKYYAPELGAFLIYLVMVAVLMWRPAGLFGRR